jgi:CheY-like chemotaxis protein
MESAQFLNKMSNNVGTKRYVLLLQRPRLMSEMESKLILKAVEHGLPGYSVIRLEEPHEGLKVLNVKNVEVVLVHHSVFNTEAEMVDVAIKLKERKKVTVIFVSKSEQDLIASYREKMSLYEEMDDYVSSPPDPTELFRKLQKVASVEGRAAKRFNVDVGVKVTRVDSLEEYDALLDDLSLVGCGLSFKENLGFRRDEQLRIKLPLFQFGLFHPQYGDFLKLALRVRRLSIRGQSIGCSIEHLTSMQHDCLVNLLEDIMHRQRMAKLVSKDKKGAQLNAR